MKHFFLVLCLLVFKPGLLLASETPHTARQAAQTDYRCAIQRLYQPAEASASLTDAVNHCVSFERGSGAWYLRHAQRSPAAEASDRAMVLQRLKSMTLVYLQQAVPRCRQAQVDEAGCLQLLKL